MTDKGGEKVKRFWVHPSNAHELKPGDVWPLGCVSIVDAVAFDRSESARREAESRAAQFKASMSEIGDRVDRRVRQTEPLSSFLYERGNGTIWSNTRTGPPDRRIVKPELREWLDDLQALEFQESARRLWPLVIEAIRRGGEAK